MNAPQLFQIPIDRIDPPTSNPRFEATELDELVASIKEIGILEPLIVVAVRGERVRLVAGLRRFTSAKIAGLKTVPCVVHARMDSRQELAVSLVENLHRMDMSPVETGEAFVKLGRTGMTQRQIGAMVGVSDYTVSTCAAIATRLCLEARTACHERRITKMAALDLTRFPAPIQRRILATLLADKEAQRIEDQGRVKERKSGHRAGEAETCLRQAINALHGHDRELAIELADKAIEIMRKTLARANAA